LVIGAFCFPSGVKVTRVGLTAYAVAGMQVQLADVAALVADESAERNATIEEPSLRWTAEVVERRMLTSRGFKGYFTVESWTTPTGITWSAYWTGEAESMALDDLVRWAGYHGLDAKRLAFEVRASLPARPALAKTWPVPLDAATVAA
jgi:hypothetical protein